MHNSAEKEHRNDKTYNDCAGNQHSKLLKGENLASKQKGTRAKGGHTATKYADTHFFVRLLHFIMT